MVRASLHYVNWKECKRVAADLKAIYRAATERQAEQELDDFVAKWGDKYQADWEALERELGRRDPAVRVSGRGAADHLHHQCGGIAAYQYSSGSKR
jgi:transposase-like protein